jgi:HEAT repeat protein
MRNLLVSAAVILLSSPALARDTIPKDASETMILELLKTGTEDQRRDGCHRLAERRSQTGIGGIGELVVGDPSVKVRAQCIKALAHIGANAQSANFIRAVLIKDSDGKVREEAMEALPDVDPQGGGSIAAQVLATDKDPRVRRIACVAVEHHRWTVADPSVAKVVADTNEVVELRRACVQALTTIGSDAGYAILHQLVVNEPNEDVRHEVSAVLERHPRATSLEPLCKALHDRNEHIVSNAAKGLKNLGRKEGAACLREAAAAVKSNHLASEMNKIASELQ